MAPPDIDSFPGRRVTSGVRGAGQHRAPPTVGRRDNPYRSPSRNRTPSPAARVIPQHIIYPEVHRIYLANTIIEQSSSAGHRGNMAQEDSISLQQYESDTSSYEDDISYDSSYSGGAIKYLSSSEPLMTAQARSPEPPSPSPGKGDRPAKAPVSSSRARQKKFHKHFKVDHDEKVENYYSCALVGDILLQGHLYITKNYFAFYSNVFGYVTKLLIPLSMVREIAKEKTARIIPNAVGVYTTDEKHHTFGSLMSREATYTHMLQTKKRFDLNEEEMLADDKDETEGDAPIEDQISDTVESSSNSGNDSPTLAQRRTPRVVPIITKVPEKSGIDGVTQLTKITMKTRDETTRDGAFQSFQKYNVFLLVSTLLLLLLFTSAGILLYRISRIQNRYVLGMQDPLNTPNIEIYNEILHWQGQLHAKSAGAVHNFLDTNLDQIAKVRKSLEALSTLLSPNSPSGTQAQAPEHRSELPPETSRMQDEATSTSPRKSFS